MTPADSDLNRLELLRAFKVRMPDAGLGANLSPFDARVSTAAGGQPAGDLPGVHAAVRDHVRQTITEVRDGKTQSQVILLSGAAGVGKTHLLRSFATPEAVADTGHVFVGGSNTWSVREFQAQLLDWVVSALTEPTPRAEHPLLHRVRAIGYRAVEHMLSNPVTWKTCLTQRRGGPIGRIRAYLNRPSADDIRRLVTARDPEVFNSFDFAAFSGYVCDKFLADRSNLAHRFALRVLLIYLFPDKIETGVGSRERVLHWLRARGDDAYFVKRLGATEKPDRAYTQFEAVKLLAHLFSPSVSKELKTDAFDCPPRVFLLTFDQAEGRNELFDSEADWRDFFANLSELYNTLPNVVVLFTMTLGLRGKLHGLMERQFQDRIRMEPKFTLAFPTDEQVLALYRARVNQWLGGDPGLQQRYGQLADPYLPLGRDEVLRLSGNQAIREGFERLDGAFREAVSTIAVDAPIDYLFDRNERENAQARAASLWVYTENHAATVKAFVCEAHAALESIYSIKIAEATNVKIGNEAALKIVFASPSHTSSVTFHLVALGFYYNNQVSTLIEAVLYNKTKAKTFLHVVRPQAMELTASIPPQYEEQFAHDICPAEAEAALASLVVVCQRRDVYAAGGQVAALDTLIRQEVAKTYLDRLFANARARLDALSAQVPEPVTA